jgi:hypothetical protein
MIGSAIYYLIPGRSRLIRKNIAPIH